MDGPSETMESQLPVLEMASTELETVKLTNGKCPTFPSAALVLLKSLKGNSRCIDCGEHNPQWAAVSYGALLCLQCSGRHRSLGVQVSCRQALSSRQFAVCVAIRWPFINVNNHDFDEFHPGVLRSIDIDGWMVTQWNTGHAGGWEWPIARLFLPPRPLSGSQQKYQQWYN